MSGSPQAGLHTLSPIASDGPAGLLKTLNYSFVVLGIAQVKLGLELGLEYLQLVLIL